MEKELRIRIPAALLKALRIEALREDTTVPKIVRGLIRAWLKEKGIEVE